MGWQLDPDELSRAAWAPADMRVLLIDGDSDRPFTSADTALLYEVVRRGSSNPPPFCRTSDNTAAKSAVSDREWINRMIRVASPTLRVNARGDKKISDSAAVVSLMVSMEVAASATGIVVPPVKTMFDPSVDAIAASAC